MSTLAAAVPGTVVPSGAEVSPGGPQGVTGTQGGTGPAGPTAVSADANNFATLGSDSLISVPGPTIWAMRLRSYNAIGNPNFEVDQISVGAMQSAYAGGKPIDRWNWAKGLSSGGAINAGITMTPTLPLPTVPGTNFVIGRSVGRTVVNTSQATLAATDSVQVFQLVEGTQWRELQGDVTSLSILCRCTVAPLTFAMWMRDGAAAATVSLVQLATISVANTWTLFPFPNLPLWSASGTYSNQPGNLGYRIGIGLAAGSSNLAPSTGVWVSGAFAGAAGMSNFMAQPVNTAFEVAFIQHEPGPVCTTLIDKPFAQNYDESLRYYQKSYEYGQIAGTITTAGMYGLPPATAAAILNTGVGFKKIMAKDPTVTLYNHATGAANSIRDMAMVDHSATATGPSQNNPFWQIASSGLSAGTGGTCYFHYVADTGW